ncbi:MAG: hypothetical protein R2708_17130 [Vicinamibacterales bacterium]
MIELPISSISRAARASSTGIAHLDTGDEPFADQRRRQRQQPLRGAPRQDVIEGGMPQHAVAGDERHVHVGALADVALGIDEDAVVEALLLGLHLHQHVRQVIGGLGDRVERRLDRVGGGHDPQAVGVPVLGIAQPGEHHHEEAGRGALGRTQLEAARAR